MNYALREKSPYLEFFWSAFSRIRTEYGEIRSIAVFSYAGTWELIDLFVGTKVGTIFVMKT